MAQDNVYGLRLARNAVHAGRRGKTGRLIGQWHSTSLHIPIELITKGGEESVRPWVSVASGIGMYGASSQNLVRSLDCSIQSTVSSSSLA